LNDVMPYILSQVVGAMCALELYRKTKN